MLAIVQMEVHLVFWLHITAGPVNTNNVLALAVGVLIVPLVIAGLADLNATATALTSLCTLQLGK